MVDFLLRSLMQTCVCMCVRILKFYTATCADDKSPGTPGLKTFPGQKIMLLWFVTHLDAHNTHGLVKFLTEERSASHGLIHVCHAGLCASISATSVCCVMVYTPVWKNRCLFIATCPQCGSKKKSQCDVQCAQMRVCFSISVQPV